MTRRRLESICLRELAQAVATSPRQVVGEPAGIRKDWRSACPGWNNGCPTIVPEAGTQAARLPDRPTVDAGVPDA